MRHRVAVKDSETAMRGDLVYTIHRDGDDKLHVYRHGAALDREPALLVLDQPNGGYGGNVRAENKGRIISSRDGV
jgi:hypothetical protein